MLSKNQITSWKQHLKIYHLNESQGFPFSSDEENEEEKSGESNLFIAIQKSKSKSGLGVWLRFSIAQHSRDLLLLESLVNFFGNSYVVKYKKRAICEFIVTKIDHIVIHIIPFWWKKIKYTVLGSKYFNYLDN